MWQADADGMRREARFAKMNRDGSLIHGDVVVDASVNYMAPGRPIVIPNGPPIWVVDHLDVPTRRREIQMVRFTEGRFVRLAAFPNPYLTSINAQRWNESIVAVGGIQDPQQGTAVSLLTKFAVQCNAA